MKNNWTQKQVEKLIKKKNKDCQKYLEEQKKQLLDKLNGEHTPKSKCCNAEVKVVGGVSDFGGKMGRGQTLHHECLRCHRTCDIIEVCQ